MGFDREFIVIGHRGAAGLLPENTLPSFALAATHGADAVELDVYAVEGSLVVIHDELVDRTTNGRGAVMEFSLAGLRMLDAGNGEPVPLLDEVLDWLPAGMGINIELKGPGTAPLVARTLRTRAELLDPSRCMVSSFDHRALARFATLGQDLPVALAPLYHRWRPTWQARVAQLNTAWLNLNEKLVNAARMRAIRDAGVAVLAYTVNTPERALELAAMGVRGIFTDRPDLLVPVFSPCAPGAPAPA
ncbi:MAG: glycerophosphodiester phosphodiesterase family protein [Pseudomonadales bacterium]